MIEKAINRILQLAKIEIVEVNGYPYSKDHLHMIQEPTPAAIQAKTLTGLIDYIANRIDKSEIATEQLIAHIISPTEVVLYSELRSDRVRESYIRCEAQVPRISFGSFLDAESFNIMMQSCFVDNDDKAVILRVVGNIQDKSVAEVGDDGVSQAVVIKTGVATLGNALVPNPVLLAPYRTFPEIQQPESSFIFRMQQGAKAALFEADGGAWKNDAIQKIKEYLSNQLTGFHNVKIIA